VANIRDAICAAGIVTADNLPVVGATILSSGVKPSTGVLLMQGAKKTYVTSNASDIQDLITALNGIITNINLVLASLDTTLNSGANAATITLITTANTQLLALKELLK
jgi:hypothetical protein